jgi:FimV-like protein
MNALNESPFYIDTYVNLIDFTFGIKCYDLVLAFFDLSKKIDSLDFDSKYKVAISFSELGFENEALEMYKGLLIEDEKDILVHYNLGLIYLENKKFKDAIECFKKVIELDCNDPGAFFNLASAYLEINDLDSANRTLNELWRLDNQSYDSFMIHGKYWEKRGDRAKSEEFYMHARQIEESTLLGEADDNDYTCKP